VSSPSSRNDPRFSGQAAALVRELTGLAFAGARRATLETGLVAGMRHAREREPEIYLARLAGEPALLDDLVERITVGESYFFREASQFELLRREILPALLRDRESGRPLRIWSAGCASGEDLAGLGSWARTSLPERWRGRGRRATRAGRCATSPATWSGGTSARRTGASSCRRESGNRSSSGG
jgi:hypothetical protein